MLRCKGKGIQNHKGKLQRGQNGKGHGPKGQKITFVIVNFEGKNTKPNALILKAINIDFEGKS